MAGVNYWHKRVYSEATNAATSLVRRGTLYHLSRSITVGGTASVFMGFSVGATSVEIEFYDMTTDTSTILASLLESPTSGSATSTLNPVNLNRTYPDSSTVHAYNTATMTGGFEVSTELVVSGSKAGSQISQVKHFVLKPNTLYGIAVVNQLNQSTAFHINLGWSEGEPEATRLWETTSAQD